MTNEKFAAVKNLITELLTDESVTFADEFKKEQIVSGIALLYDQMLYEHSGKKIPYRDYRTVYRIWNSEHMESRKTYTLAELAEYLNTSLSTIFQIVEGKYWPYHGFTPYYSLEDAEEREIRQMRGRELLGLSPCKTQPVIVKAPERPEEKKELPPPEPLKPITLTMANDPTRINYKYITAEFLEYNDQDFIAVDCKSPARIENVVIEVSADGIDFSERLPLMERKTPYGFITHQSPTGNNGELLINAADGKHWYRLAYTLESGDIAYGWVKQSRDLRPKPFDIETFSI